MLEASCCTRKVRKLEVCEDVRWVEWTSVKGSRGELGGELARVRKIYAKARYPPIPRLFVATPAMKSVSAPTSEPSLPIEVIAIKHTTF